VIRERVLKAAMCQAERYKDQAGIYSNAQISSKMLREVCVINTAGHNLLKTAMERLNLSGPRVRPHLKSSPHHRRPAGSADIKVEHLAEAIQYRSLDREGWAG
jgi:magnesium chelatase family protein